MHTLPNWGWWIVAAGLLLLSPVFAFFFALLVEVLIGMAKEGGVSALITFISFGFAGRLLFRKLRKRPPMGKILGDQA